MEGTKTARRPGSGIQTPATTEASWSKGSGLSVEAAECRRTPYPLDPDRHCRHRSLAGRSG